MNRYVGLHRDQRDREAMRVMQMGLASGDWHAVSRRLVELSGEEVVGQADNLLNLAERFYRPLSDFTESSVRGMQPQPDELMIHLSVMQIRLLVEVVKLLEASREV